MTLEEGDEEEEDSEELEVTLDEGDEEAEESETTQESPVPGVACLGFCAKLDCSELMRTPLTPLDTRQAITHTV